MTDAQTAADRRLAHERLVNFEWELRVESLRLRVIEAQLALEAKLSEVRELQADVYRAHLQIATQTLEPMQTRYRVVAEDQERDLTRAKANEENKARSSDDPLERFPRPAHRRAAGARGTGHQERAGPGDQPAVRRTKSKRPWRTAPTSTSPISKNCSKTARSAGSTRFASTTSFAASARNATDCSRTRWPRSKRSFSFTRIRSPTVELELLQDSLHDRFEHDLLRERLPPSRLGRRGGPDPRARATSTGRC